EIIKPYFTEGQIRCIVERRRWVHWSIDDYALAISLRNVSPKAYMYLRLKLNYPLLIIKGKELTSFEKITVITFDEMALSPEVCFDSKIEKLVGPCKKVQVIMVRGLFSKWKQPIYYKFDQPMTKDILIEGVNRLYDAGYEVIAITSDMGNKGVWGELNITPENHFFEHPVIKNAKIFVFADVPHLLKLLRNWLIDKGLLLLNCSEPFTAAVFQAIIDMNKDGDLHVAHRITQRILDARNSLRQAVRPAAQIWSHTAAKAIKWAGERGILKVREYAKFSDFVSTVNNWFDVHNSQQKYGAHPGVNGFGVDIEKQEQSLILMTLYVENMKVCSKKSIMPFQKGILISNASLRGLYDQLKRTHEQQFQYLLTRCLQQDVLKNFFAYIRAMGSCKDHPSGYEFRYRLRWYVLGKHSHAVFTMNRNTEEDVNTSCMSSYTAEDLSSISADSQIPSTSAARKTSTAVIPTVIASTLKQMCTSTPTRVHSENSTLDSKNASHIVQEEGLQYVAGYIAHRFKRKYPHLGERTGIASNENTETNWIKVVSKGYLIYPSIELLRMSRLVEKCFNDFHGHYFSKEDYVIQKVIKLVQNNEEYDPCIPQDVLQCLVRTRTYIQVRTINKR
ncbi:Transposable element P transposase, partial [Camponotus floridanus]